MALTPEERRRLAEVFGESSDQTSGQTSDDLPEAGERGRDEEWWRAQRPPHHGG